MTTLQKLTLTNGIESVEMHITQQLANITTKKQSKNYSLPAARNQYKALVGEGFELVSNEAIEESDIKVDACEYCPIHNTELKKEYTFGKYQDASLYTYQGCNCAVVWKNNGFNDTEYFVSYEVAAGKSRLTVQQASLYA